MRASGFLLAALLGLAATATQASGLRLTPLRLDLSARTPTTQIELANLGPAPVSVQVKAFAWSQVEGRDAYAPTQDIFFAPPIVTVPAQGKALVRFRLRGKAPAQTQANYRVYFQELPPAQEQVSNGMAFRLRFGVPLFVDAARPAPAQLSVSTAPGTDRAALVLENGGDAHLRIEGLALYPAGTDRERPGEPLASATHSIAGTNYLLPRTRHAWEIPLPAGQDPAGLQLLVRTNDYSGRASAGMSNRGWLWLPLTGPPRAAP